MSFRLFLGVLGVALAPLLSMFTIFIAPNSIRVLFWIFGGFCWLVSLLVGSLFWIIWYSATPSGSALQDDLTFAALISVFVQEGFRLLSLWGLANAVQRLESINIRGSARSGMSGSSGQFVLGLGFGTISCLFHSMNVMAAALGPGSPGLEIDGVSHGSPSFYITGAFLSAALTFNHCSWTVILGSSLNKGLKNSWHLPVFVVIAHLLTTGTSLFNDQGSIWPCMISSWVVVIASGAFAFREAGLKGLASAADFHN
ncbi:Oidioi.mRNA.OKI2018_I69.XSR.g15738.t1.cds [Oikopleura dioica]|uniref:Oidioi.mRNA.OKI2018_I69.XSR.g15738.t1.cds n=1 Tax=Oikopleura dioica TaxID=34765 RepID=A0ABN7SHT7_OIKDI|nr:Oidioi.mRNA.OKI2018_I69.XSR.g15738.t1.cds [Oikopleura dioica]